MRVSSLVGAAEAPPLAPTLVGADVLGGPLHPPVLPLTSLSPPPRLKKYKKERESLSANPLVRIYSNG